MLYINCQKCGIRIFRGVTTEKDYCTKCTWDNLPEAEKERNKTKVGKMARAAWECAWNNIPDYEKENIRKEYRGKGVERKGI